MMRRSGAMWAEQRGRRALKRIALACFVGLCLSTGSAGQTAGAQEGRQRPSAGGEVVDKVVATVNGKLITYTDLLWQLALEPGTPLDSPRQEDLERALDLVIDQRLIYQEAEKLPHIHAEDAKALEAALAEFVRRFPSQAEFQRRVARVGLTAEKLREIVRERVEIEKYVSFRFRSFTVVSPQEIESHYRAVYVPRFRQRTPGRIVPKLDEARAEIERTLTEDKIASDLAKYFEEARAGAEVVIISPP